jgi:hypothetical protein
MVAGKTPTRVHRLIDSIYGAELLLLIGPSNGLTTWLTRHGYPADEEAPAQGKTIELVHPTHGDAVWIVWMPADAVLSTIAHECVHLAAEVLRNRDVVLTRDSEEAFAYYVSSMFEQMRALLQRTRSPSKIQRRPHRKARGRRARR